MFYNPKPISNEMQEYTNYINNVSGKILLGCDGFVDETYEIVDVRKGPDEFDSIEKLKTFGELLVKRADGGVGLEIVAKRRCEGGFGINTGRIAGCLGIKPVLPGLYGGAEIDSAFQPFTDICDLYSVGDPALTLVFEFTDGKVLMSDLAAVSNLCWEDVVNQLGQDKLKEMFAGVDIMGVGYWSLTANFDGLLEGFMAQYETMAPPRRMFFDFADIKKKSSESFMKSMELIKQYNSKVPMTLSVNEHEVLEVFARLGIECTDHSPAGITASLAMAREKSGLDEIIVHTPEFAAGASSVDGAAYALQDRQTNVVRLAGAGDSFNGGYICASLGKLPMKNRLVMANAATAFFVTHGTGPTKEQLIAQIEKASDK